MDKSDSTGHVTQFISNAAQAAKLNIPYPYSGWRGAAYQAIAPYPQVARTYSHIYFVNTPLGETRYNAFVVQVTKRSSRGLSLNLNYTLSKLTGNTNNAFTDTYSSSHGFQDPYKYAYYAQFPEAGYAPQVLKGFANYHLPFGRGQRYFNHNRIADFLIGGWLAGVIVDYESGAPLASVKAQHNYPGWSNVWANVAPNANFKNTFKKLDLINLADPSNDFVDRSIFGNPADGQLGNSPVSFGNWHGWGTSNEDVSLMKKFAVGRHGRYVLTLRGEFFNVLNRHHYANPALKIGGVAFGRVTHVVGNARQGQVGARFSW